MRRNYPNRDPKPVYAVIGDGPTESDYFESIKNEFKDQLSHCNLKPDIPRHTNMSELGRLIDKCLKYDKVLCIVDMDTKLRNPAEMSKYKKLKNRYAGNRDTQVHFYETHPCSELWFYYYFKGSR